MAKSFKQELFNIPNTISLFRVFAAPMVAFLWLSLDCPVAGFILGILSGLTDQLDGYLARKLKQTSELGALIDQAGDLIFESTCILIGIVSGYLWYGLLIIYLFREFIVTAVRSYIAKNGGELPSSMLGRVKSSFIQWSFFPFFLGGILIRPGIIDETINVAGFSPGEVLIGSGTLGISIGLFLGIISAVAYLKGFVNFYVKRQEALSK